MAIEVPKVFKDPELREFTSGVSVRPEVIARLMAAGGVELDEIPEHTLYFSAGRGQEDVSGKEIHYGKYSPSTLTTTVFMGSHYDGFLFYYQHWLNKTGVWPPTAPFTRRVRTLSENEVNSTLFHETKHAIDFNQMGIDNYLREEAVHRVSATTRRGCRQLAGLYAAVGVEGLGLYGLAEASVHNETASPLWYILAGGAAVYGLQSVVRTARNRSNHQHQDYLTIPGEVRASEYEAEQLALITNPSQLPVRVKFKTPTREQLAA